MPDPGSRAVYMLSGHATAGVNWRPTRFAEDLPQPRICGLCCTVPKRTVLLPCSHFLCDSCNAARDKDGRRVCPLDMKAFEEDECSWIDFPAKRASNLKNISRVISGFDNRLQQSMESMEANISSMLIRQLNAGLSELKALLGDRCSDDLTTVQSQMNQLVEESRARDAAQLQEILCALKDSENKLEADVDRVETNLSSALMQQLQVSP
ncbi:hypothetical protein HPB49_013605 [Dermacentor silvarum]|uniref:Uncharacterized protein n=1 Tax=Dermacentor silvarum TaxID=543639 RepID=A0ACB8DPJ8_DERSI|nr:hypothetical protein HPB49_013605 [Dermacentor silvarum]